MLAGAASDVYLTKLVNLYGYAHALHGILILGLLLIALLFFVIRDKKKYLLENSDAKPLSFQTLMIGLRHIALNHQMWLIGIFGAFAYLPASVFLDVWGIPYLVSAHHLTSSQAGFAISFVFIGWIISGPLLGGLSDWIGRRQLPLIIASLGTLLIIGTILYGPILTITSLSCLLFLFGFFAGVHPLVFALGRENNPDQFAATSTAFLNTLIMLGGVIFQPAVGLLLDWHHGKNSLGMSYTSHDYTFALSILPFCLLLTFILTFFLRETYCQTSGEKSNAFQTKDGLEVNSFT